MESKQGAEEMGIHASNRFAQGGRKRNLDPKGTKKSGTIFQMNRDRNESQRDHYIITTQELKKEGI